ncbi:acyltransferase family protein [Paraburkholderia fungorum]|jgi:peptidoglycan/LPS O-acetylase OafA/YrhL|uniref:acyltransferase family protein n=1 Tax=Paraburkholderia fungorum TaxID=134537 RepID=UPI000DB8D2AD|nr:acyltransferase [Paraburkholderia fungorum]PZR38264.1 MAG: acyltransferase [Paraburkholderia fungorum]
MNNRSRSGIPALTGMRFIAALMVFVSHYPVPGLGGAFKRIADSGYIGVTFFFILSGFVIGYNYLDAFEKHTRGHTISYVIARFARVYPLYLFCTLFVWLSTGAKASFLMYAFALQAWSPDFYTAFGLDGPAWSISVEAFLYLSFPLLVVLFRALGALSNPRRLLVVALAVVLAIAGLALYFTLTGRGALSPANPASAHRWLYRTPLTRVFDFALGILAATWYSRFSAHISDQGRRGWTLAVYGAIVLMVSMAAWKPLFFSAFSWDAAYAVPFIVVIVGTSVRQESGFSKALSTPVMILLGEASFAFYLIHLVLGSMYSQAPEGLTKLAFYAAFLIFVTVVSVGLHVGIEKPCRDLIKRLIPVRQKKGIAHAPGADDPIRTAG